MDFIWKTPMRANLNGTDEDRAARETDRLAGQAAARRLDDGRWQVLVMPDKGTFDSVVTVSVGDMRALAHAILDTDRHPLEAPALARVEIIDVAEHARKLYGGQDGADRIAAVSGRPVPEHDYRFHTNYDQHSGSLWTAGRGATAADIMLMSGRDRALKAKGL